MLWRWTSPNSFCPHLPLLVQSVSGQGEWRDRDELREKEKDRRGSPGVSKTGAEREHIMVFDILTCEGQLGLMDTLLRRYLAEDTGLKTIIPSLQQINIP